MMRVLTKDEIIVGIKKNLRPVHIAGLSGRFYHISVFTYTCESKHIYFSRFDTVVIETASPMQLNPY